MKKEEAKKLIEQYLYLVEQYRTDYRHYHELENMLNELDKKIKDLSEEEYQELKYEIENEELFGGC